MESEGLKGRILVVEDDPMILMDVTRAFERAGFEVASAMRGLAAVKAFESATAAPSSRCGADGREPRSRHGRDRGGHADPGNGP